MQRHRQLRPRRIEMVLGPPLERSGIPSHPSRNRCSSAHTTVRISSIASPLPGQFIGPYQNGMYAPSLWTKSAFAALSFSRRVKSQAVELQSGVRSREGEEGNRRASSIRS